MGLTGKGISFIAAFVSRRFPDAPQVVDAAEGRSDVTEVCKSLVSAAGENALHTLLGESDEVRAQNDEWLTFAGAIHTDDKLKSTYLRTLDTYLLSRAVFVGVGTSTGIADVALFVSIYDQVIALPKEELKTYTNLLRWFDYVQHKEDQSQAYEWIAVEKPTFNPPIPSSEPEMKKMAAAAQTPSEKEKSSTATSATSAATADNKSNKKESIGKSKATVSSDVEKKVDAKDVNKKEKKVADEPKEKKDPAPVQKDSFGFDILDIRVGVIESVKRHPSADTLYVEEINIGEGNVRQVVSGLAKYLTEEQMLKRRVLVLANVKPSKLRDVMSAGLVLCASNEDHTLCEPVLPPEGASIGERVVVSGYEGKPEPVLNPKKKQWDKLYPDLHTDETGVACYQGKPLMTGAGACTSAITKGSINSQLWHVDTGELYEPRSGKEHPEEILELDFCDRITSAASRTGFMASQPKLARTAQRTPLQQFGTKAWNTDSNADFVMAVDWKDHPDIHYDAIFEDIETCGVSPNELFRHEADVMGSTFGHPLGNDPFSSIPEQYMKEELFPRWYRYGAETPMPVWDELSTAGNPVFGGHRADLFGTLGCEEVIDSVQCVRESLGLDFAVYSRAGVSPGCTNEDSSYISSSQATSSSWDYSPVSEVLDDGCINSGGEELECSLPQEDMDRQDVVPFHGRETDSRPLPPGRSSARGLRPLSAHYLELEKKISSSALRSYHGKENTKTVHDNCNPVHVKVPLPPEEEIMVSYRADDFLGTLSRKPSLSVWDIYLSREIPESVGRWSPLRHDLSPETLSSLSSTPSSPALRALSPLPPNSTGMAD